MSEDPFQTATADVRAAIAAFARGEPVLVHDFADREGETDLIYPAAAVTPDAVARLRTDAGGLICVALSDSVAAAFDLDFIHERVDHPAVGFEGLGYDDRSSFSLPVNHRETYTGITDEDRALTITELARAASAPEACDFAATFRIPGHVPVLRAAPGLFANRQGHTEFAIALAAAADRAPAAVVCEMLDDRTHQALPPERARAYADRQRFQYVEGSDLLAALGD